jgi:hypothetical protein
MRVAFGVLLTALLLATPVAAQNKTAISFTCTCNDATGTLFATAFRDLLATSPRYSEETKETKDVYAFRLMVVSLDPTVAKDGYQSVLAVVFVMGSVYISEQVQTCGMASTKTCAERTLAFVDQNLNSN